MAGQDDPVSFEREKQFLSRSYKSKEEFIKEYEKIYNRKPKAHELFPLYISSLEAALSENDAARILKFSIMKNVQNTLLAVAIKKNSIIVVRFLIDQGVNVNSKGPNDESPLHVAAKYGFKDVALVLLENGAAFDSVDNKSRTPLDVTTNDEIGELLRSTGKLFDSVKENNCAEVLKLVKTAFVSARDMNGLTALHIAAEFASKDVVRVLLENGCPFDSVDKQNRTPFCMSDKKEIIDLLKVTAKLFTSVKEDGCRAVELDLKDGACINAKNSKSATPLHYASWKGNEKVVDFLLRNGANPNITNNKGATALHYAAKFSHLKVLKTLLHSGAIYNYSDVHGKTPKDFTLGYDALALLGLIHTSFEKIMKKDISVISDLNAMKENDNIKAVMCAKNLENETLIVAAIRRKFSKIDQLKAVGNKDETEHLVEAQDALIEKKPSMALTLFKQALRKRIYFFGADSPATLDVQAGIAEGLLVMKNYEEALKLFEEVSEKFTAMFGVNYVKVVDAKFSIAKIIKTKQGDFEKAHAIFEECYEKRKEMFGPDDPTTIESLFCMGESLEAMEKYEYALRVYKQVYKQRKKLFGVNCDSTLCALHNIATVAANLGQYQDALKMFKDVYQIRKKKYSASHEDTIKSLFGMANALSKLNKHSEAMKSFDQVLKVQKSRQAPNHPEILLTQYSMANTLFNQNMNLEALKIYREILEPAKISLGSNHTIVSDCLQKIESIESQADPNTLKFFDENREKLQRAACSGDVEVVKQILSTTDADVNGKDDGGLTPLHHAILNGRPEVVKILLAKGADVRIVSENGDTALHAAVLMKDENIVKLLLQYAHERNMQDEVDAVSCGATPLHRAVEINSIEMVKLLLKYGATYDVLNGDGKMAVDLSNDKRITYILRAVHYVLRGIKRSDVLIFDRLSKLHDDEILPVINARNSDKNTLLGLALTLKLEKFSNMLFHIILSCDDSMI